MSVQVSPISRAIIRDTINLSTVLQHKKAGTWFIFDIDNVLLKTPSQLGSDQWFRWRCKFAGERGEPFEKALNHWTALQLMIDTKPVEEKTADVIKSLQKEDFPTFAITSRGLRLGDRTVEQLKSADIDFSVNPIEKEEIFWPRGLTERVHEHVLFEKGILFTAGQNKGVGLTKLTEIIKKKPEEIVYIDDSRNHIENVAKACHDLGIKMIGYHYRKLEPWVNEFDSKIAEKGVLLLEQLLKEDEKENTLQLKVS